MSTPCQNHPAWNWNVPAYFNIGVACTDAHLGTPVADRIAMIVEDDNLGTTQITYAQLAARTTKFAQLLRNHGVAAGEWYRIVTVGLIHGGFLHLGFNMYALLVLGNPLEQLFGRVRFLSIFFFSLIAGSLTSLWLNPPYQLSVGVSGALFGLFAAFALVAKRIGADVKSILFIIGINFAMAFFLPGIDWHAHVGGLLGGLIATTVVLRGKR